MVPPALERAVEQFRLHAERSDDVAGFWSLAGLYKLAAVGMTQFEWVGVLDLDVSPYVLLPLQWMLNGRKRATELLGCSNSDERKESTMAPMNAGYLAFRPNASAYHVLALLRSPPSRQKRIQLGQLVRLVGA